MRFWKTILGLARKKFVGPPVVVAAIGLALAAYFLMPSSYVSTASMVLTVPATGGTLETEPASKPGLTNPLLQFNDALRTTAGILILATNRADVYKEVGAPDGGPVTVTINDGRTNPDLLSISTNGPFIYVEVEGDDPAAVREVMRKAQQRVRLELGRRQTELDAPISTHIGIMDVMPPSGPRAVVSDRLMFAGFGGVFGLIAGIGVAYGVQRVRWSRAPAAPEPAPVPEQEEPEVWAEVVAEQPRTDGEAGDKLNGSRPHAPATVSGFPMTVDELEAERTGPIQLIKEEPAPDAGKGDDGDGQLDSTT
ncbi:hypothetical protein FXF51_05345 [Nonomuraea sp. PA05]|uniref:hypothetical protein n=1 Tax=Nonomuraea sp. PA05 TaxID=2604466 RepID=UPI0011D3B962|nr:hypothetical protein [Nonomuraea sp. PA05]TYB69597.1 hypothetical protein FXF51_05345 [Nonomuraea sp. PA05]